MLAVIDHHKDAGHHLQEFAYCVPRDEGDPRVDEGAADSSIRSNSWDRSGPQRCQGDDRDCTRPGTLGPEETEESSATTSTRRGNRLEYADRDHRRLRGKAGHVRDIVTGLRLRPEGEAVLLKWPALGWKLSGLEEDADHRALDLDARRGDGLGRVGRQVGDGSRGRGTEGADGERHECVGGDTRAAGEGRALTRSRAAVEGEDVIRRGRVMERPAHDRTQLQNVSLGHRGSRDGGEQLIVRLAYKRGLNAGRLGRQARDRVRRVLPGFETGNNR